MRRSVRGAQLLIAHNCARRTRHDQQAAAPTIPAGNACSTIYQFQSQAARRASLQDPSIALLRIHVRPCEHFDLHALLSICTALVACKGLWLPRAEMEVEATAMWPPRLARRTQHPGALRRVLGPSDSQRAILRRDAAGHASRTRWLCARPSGSMVRRGSSLGNARQVARTQWCRDERLRTIVRARGVVKLRRPTRPRST